MAILVGFFKFFKKKVFQKIFKNFLKIFIIFLKFFLDIEEDLSTLHRFDYYYEVIFFIFFSKLI